MAYLLHQLLRESAIKFPDREAIRFNGAGMTYSRLNNLTDQVAAALQKAGVQRGDRVAIYLPKSLASIISVFGILKSGGIYVPLDPNAPARRLAYITRNCGVKVLLTIPEKLGNLAEFFSDGTPLHTVILMDTPIKPIDAGLPDFLQIIDWAAVLDADPDDLTDRGTIETDLAYILYTSGSTGDPKGVMISHRTILTFINWCCDTFQMRETDRVTSHAPLHFDLSTFDIYATIKAGGTVVLVPEKLSIFPIQLVRLLQDEAITITYLVPSILTLMVNYGKLEGHDLSSLRAILFAGEVFPIKYLRQLVAAVPHPDYYNLYGPTETNVCTYYKVDKVRDLDPARTKPVPIGRACENMEVFAVDEDGNLVTQPGIEGELWVRGSCVAQGYWGDRGKTEKNFVHNPHQLHFDEIAYRTGDVVVLDDDGLNWHYIGRRDHMVKSRGYRIELGEIEAVLYGNQAIKEAAVVAVPDELIGSRIKAYVVPMKENGLTEKDLQQHCSLHLPRYMIPEQFEFRDALPKTSTGKVDRQALMKG
jgi:amino acid adenylation domain-containing protein